MRGWRLLLALRAARLARPCRGTGGQRAPPTPIVGPRDAALRHDARACSVCRRAWRKGDKDAYGATARADEGDRRGDRRRRVRTRSRSGPSATPSSSICSAAASRGTSPKSSSAAISPPPSATCCAARPATPRAGRTRRRLCCPMIPARESLRLGSQLAYAQSVLLTPKDAKKVARAARPRPPARAGHADRGGGAAPRNPAGRRPARFRPRRVSGAAICRAIRQIDVRRQFRARTGRPPR